MAFTDDEKEYLALLFKSVADQVAHVAEAVEKNQDSTDKQLGKVTEHLGQINGRLNKHDQAVTRWEDHLDWHRACLGPERALELGKHLAWHEAHFDERQAAAVIAHLAWHASILSACLKVLIACLSILAGALLVWLLSPRLPFLTP